MKTLITGVSGFLGSALAKTLLQARHHVTGICNKSNPPEDLQNNENFRWIKADLSKGFSEDLAEYYDVVFHLAGATLGKGKDEAVYFKNNETATFNVLKEFAGKTRRVVFASTQAVYGDPDSLCVNENFPLNGLDTSYGCSKINCENWMKTFYERYGGQYAVLRFTGFVEDPGSAVSFFIGKALNDEPLELYSMGRICRDYLSLEDGMSAFMKAAEADLKDGFRVYNIGSGDSLPASGLAEHIIKESDSKSLVIPVEKQAPRKSFVYDIKRAREELNFNPCTVKEAVSKYICGIKGESYVK